MKYNMLIIKKANNSYKVMEYDLAYLADSYLYNLSCIATELNKDTMPHIIQINKQIFDLIKMLYNVNESNFESVKSCCAIFLVTLALSKLPIAGNDAQNIININFYYSDEFINDYKRVTTEGPASHQEVYCINYKGNVSDKIKELSDDSNFNKQTKAIKEFIKTNAN